MPRITDLLMKYFKDKTKRRILIPAVAGVLILCLSFLMPGGEKKIKEHEEFSIEDYRKDKERELKEFVQKIDGVERCSIMISYKDKGSAVFSYNRDLSKEKEDEREKNEMVVLRKDGDEHPVTERISLPEISGITVICDAKRGMEITLAKAVSNAAGAKIHNVEVIINERN